MSFGPISGLPASAAGAPFAQTHGSDAERAVQETRNLQRKTSNDLKADKAAGVGETDGEDTMASERDADGRRLWEQTEEPHRHDQEPDADNPTPSHRQSRDASGAAGNRLDLTG